MIFPTLHFSNITAERLGTLCYALLLFFGPALSALHSKPGSRTANFTLQLNKEEKEKTQTKQHKV